MAQATIDTGSAGQAVHTRTTGTAGIESQAVVIGIDGSDSVIPASPTLGIGVDVKQMPAAARTTDSIAAALVTDKVMNDLTALTPKFKFVSVAASQTDSSVISGVSTKKLRLLAVFVMVGATATDITLESDDASADTTVVKFTPGANGGAVLPFNPVGWNETDAGEGLIATTSAGATAQILVVYVEV